MLKKVDKCAQCTKLCSESKLKEVLVASQTTYIRAKVCEECYKWL